MLAHGWLDEVKALINSGLNDQAKPFDFIGYRELARRSPRRNAAQPTRKL